jgi:hypothetical protein
LNLTPGAFSLTSINFAPFVAFTTPLTSHHSTKLPLTKLPSFSFALNTLTASHNFCISLPPRRLSYMFMAYWLASSPSHKASPLSPRLWNIMHTTNLLPWTNTTITERMPCLPQSCRSAYDQIFQPMITKQSASQKIISKPLSQSSIWTCHSLISSN